MNVKGILSVSGKSGLFKIIVQTKNKVVIQDILKGKRFVISLMSKMTSLEDISIYTYSEEVSLSKVLDKISNKECGKESISHQSSNDELLNYFMEVLHDFDKDRVYISDIKKVIYWYNILQKVGMAIPSKEEGKETNESIDSL